MHHDSTTQETWAPCRSHGRTFPVYEVSTLGRVRRTIAAATGVPAGHLLKPRTGSNGYPRITLCDAGQHLTCPIHRLVAAAFLGDPAPGHNVNHKNGIKTDNRLENLEYTTQQENDAHARRIGLTDQRGSRSPNAKITEADVIEIRRLASEGILRKVIAQRFGLGCHYVSEIIVGRSWAHVPPHSAPPRDAPYYKRVTRICQWCGSEFLMQPSDLKHRPGRFCNRKCSARARYSSKQPG